MSDGFMSAAERAEVRRSLDGAVLHVALLAASLQINRRLEMRINAVGRFEIKIAGEPSPLMTLASPSVAVRFLDHLGVDA
jgi:hypothetical protein